MITIFQKTVKDAELKKLPEFRVGSWIYVESPSPEEVLTLTSQFGLEEGYLKDALDPYEVPRVEMEESGAYFFTRLPFQENDHVITAPMLIVIGIDFLMTVSQRPLPFLEKFVSGRVHVATTQKIKLFLQIVQEVNSLYSKFVTAISKNVRATSVNVERISNKDIVQFVRFEGALNDFMGALVPSNVMLSNLLSGKSLQLYEEDKDLMEDLSLHAGQLVELCRSSLKTIVNIREAYSTIVTNNLNRVIKFLTALTILLTVPTMIASLYGMNVPLPLADSPFAFWIILGSVLGISGTLLWVFSKNRWF
ncbi:MAG: magnesium transporter CorA family protein [bacterium]|nr:magnesium transporter CorA family protein [bacterium]